MTGRIYRDVLSAKQQIINYLSSDYGAAFHNFYICKQMKGVNWATTRNALVKLKKANIIENPIPRHWRMKSNAHTD